MTLLFSQSGEQGVWFIMYADMAGEQPAETPASASMSKDLFFRVLTVVNRNQAVIAERQREAAAALEALEARQARRVARLNRQLDNVRGVEHVEGPRERRQARRPNYHFGLTPNSGFVVHMENTDE